MKETLPATVFMRDPRFDGSIEEVSRTDAYTYYTDAEIALWPRHLGIPQEPHVMRSGAWPHFWDKYPWHGRLPNGKMGTAANTPEAIQLLFPKSNKQP